MKNPLIPDSPTPPDEAAGEIPELRQAFEERRWYYHAFRQAFGRGGSTYALSRSRTQENSWRIECILPGGNRRTLAALDSYEDALRLLDYCTHRDMAVKLALIQLYEHGNIEPLEKLVAEGKITGELPRRRATLQLSIVVEMRGTDEEIRSYVEAHCRASLHIKAARVTQLAAPRLEEPRPLREDETYG